MKNTTCVAKVGTNKFTSVNVLAPPESRIYESVPTEPVDESPPSSAAAASEPRQVTVS